MQFVSVVRRAGVPTPPQRAFNEEKWRAAFARHNDGSQEDQDLFEAGLWIAQRLATARAVWATLPRLPLPALEIAQALVGAVNRQSAISAARAIDIALAPLDAQQPLLEDLAEGVQHLVSSLKVPLANALGGVEPDGPEDLSEQHPVFHGVLGRLHLGQHYAGLLHLWNQCVAHRWFVHAAPAADVIAPRDESREKWFAAAHFRRDSIFGEISHRAAAAWMSMGPKRRAASADVPVVDRVERHGKRIRPQLGKADSLSGSPPYAWIARVLAREAYLEDIIDEPLPAFGEIRTRDLLNAIWCLSPLAEILGPTITASAEPPDLHDLLAAAPRLHRDDLASTIEHALGLTRERALRVLETLSFDGTARDDLWHKPIVPLDGPWVTLVFEALRSPNLLWLIDRWLRDGEYDMGARGLAFETHLRKTLAEAVTLDDADVLEQAFELRPPSGPVEEIDLMLRIGQTVLVGEAKCTVYPTEPFEFLNYEETLREGADQAARKANAVRTNPSELIAATGWHSLRADQLVVVPVVVSNLPLGTGHPETSAPVTDEYILIRYLSDGGVEQDVVLNPDGTREASTYTQFFTTPAEAARNLPAYLQAPPQYTLLRNAVRVNVKPILSGDTERLAAYVDYSAAPLRPPAPRPRALADVAPKETKAKGC